MLIVCGVVWLVSPRPGVQSGSTAWLRVRNLKFVWEVLVAYVDGHGVSGEVLAHVYNTCTRVKHTLAIKIYQENGCSCIWEDLWGEPPNLVNRDISSPMTGSIHQVNDLLGQARSPIISYLVI